MNEHLRPVIEDLLPELERERISYWVYGGVGIAAVAGRFIRRNGDVDIFVEEHDFERAILLLEKKCNEIGLTPHPCRPLNGRPKFEVRPNAGTKDMLSVVPVYRKDGFVEFIFGRRRGQCRDEMLARTSRNIDGYAFFAPQDDYIRELLKTYIMNRRKLRTRAEIWNNIRLDAAEILTPDEIRRLKIPPGD